MKRTSIGGLVGAGLFVAAAAAILTARFYGSMMSFPATVSVSLWAMVLVCGYLTWRVRVAKSDESHGIGLDSSQLNPMTVMQYMLTGRASAWTGSLVGGAYLGIAAYVVPHVGSLAAAASDVTGVVTSALGGVALSIAGVILERHCEVPPPPDGQQAVS